MRQLVRTSVELGVGQRTFTRYDGDGLGVFTRIALDEFVDQFSVRELARVWH